MNRKQIVFGGLFILAAVVLASGGAWAHPVTIITQSDPPGLTPLPPVSMDGGVTDIPPGGAASFWVNPTAGWEWTANLYNLGGFGVNVAGGGDPLCTPHVTVTNATLYKGNATWPAPGHYNWYQILNPTGNIVVTVTFKPIMYDINLVWQSDPPGLTVPDFWMDGNITQMHGFQGCSFWVNSDATKDTLPYTAFQATTDQYNLGAWDWPPSSPDYADGGDPLCTPRVTVSNAKLYKGNASWPVADHFDWYNVYGATGDVTITATYKPRDIPVSYGSYITGPAVVYHEFTGHSIVVTPEVRTGYTLTGVATTSGATSDNGNGTWTVSAVTELSGITVSAAYTPISYTVGYAADPVAGGSATGAASITHDGTTGDAITVTVTPNAGWSVTGVTASNGSIVPASGNDYTLSGVTANTTVTATFTPIVYTVGYVANPAAGGSATGAASITHDGTPGDAITVTVTPNVGWSVTGVTASNGTVVPVSGNDYTLSGVTANTTVTATFAPIAYTVGYVANPAAGGSATGAASITHDGTPGDAITVTVTPNVGWSVTGVTASNGSVSPVSGNDYTLSGVTANTTVTATFAPIAYTVGYAADPAAGGSATGATSITHDGTPGDAITVTVTPNVGWSITNVTASNGTVVPVSGNDYTLSGVTANTTVTAIFEDIEAPEAVCQNVTVNLSSPTISASVLDGGSTDNVAVTSWLIDGAASKTFSCADMPSTSVILTVADAAGNSDTCTATVTVVDDISPSALCQDITVNLSTPTILAAALDGGSSDNCAITSQLIDGAADKTFTCANVGANTVTLRVEDAAGNYDECTATVTVVDDVAPVAVCQNITVNLSSPTITASAIDGGSTDNCGITSRLINGAASRTFTCAHLGNQLVTLRVTDAAGNFNECTATVTVVDDIPPVAGCRGAVTVNLSSPTLMASALNLGSTDNCGGLSYQIDGAPSRTFTCAELGPNAVTLTVLDGAGNTATCGPVTVTVVDNIGACVEGEGEGEGEPPVEGEGEPPVEGEGEPPVEGEGEPPIEGEGEAPVEGEGEPPVEGEGEPPVEGEGEPQGLTVTADPTEFTVAEGTSVTFEVQVSGAQGVLSYQWNRYTPDKMLTPIPDATDSTYTLSEITFDDAGQYQCEVYDDVLEETVLSPIFTLAVGSGVPVVGLLGLALASALTALAGTSVLRKKK